MWQLCMSHNFSSAVFYVLWRSVGDYNESDYSINDWGKGASQTPGDTIIDTKKAERNTKWNFSFIDKLTSFGFVEYIQNYLLDF